MKNIQANKKIYKKNQDGIALIITIILSSIMLTSVLLVSREMVDEVRNSTRIDNSLIAYYAAESGLEDALLEWRYNHDKEIPTTTLNITDDSPTPNGSPKEYTKSYYELTMTNRVSNISDQVILKDDVFEFSVENMNQDINLNWTFNPDTDNQYKVEITTYNELGEILDQGKFFTDLGVNSQLLSSGIGSGGGKRIFRIKPWYTSTLTLPSGVIPYINLNITSPAQFSSPITEIESVGYYGGVARKIIARIDRTSGGIISINDFAIYSASDLIK